MQSNKICSIECPYKKQNSSFLHIGNLYFINRTIITKQTEDRDFFYRVMVGKPLLDESDDIFYDPLSTVFKDHEDTQIKIQEHTTFQSSEYFKNIYMSTLAIIQRVNSKTINNDKESLNEVVQNTKPSEHVKHILSVLNKGIVSPQHFSMNEYLNIIIMFILDKNDKYTQSDILTILRYLILCFIPRDENDFPALKVTNTQLKNLELKTINLPDDHPFKWSSKRIALVNKQPTLYKRYIYLNDYMYLWKIHIITDTSIQEVTDADIRVKYIVDTIFQKLSFEYSTEIIIIHKITEVSFERLKKVLREIFKIIKIKENTGYFSVYNDTDILLKPQIENQYVLQLNEPKHLIEAKAKSKKARRATAQEVFNYLNDNNLIKKVTIL